MCIRVVTQYVSRLLLAAFVSELRRRTQNLLNHHRSLSKHSARLTYSRERIFSQRRRSVLLYNRIKHTRTQHTKRAGQQKKIHQQQSALVSSERLDGGMAKNTQKTVFSLLARSSLFFFCSVATSYNDMVSDILNGKRGSKKCAHCEFTFKKTWFWAKKRLKV